MESRYVIRDSHREVSFTDVKGQLLLEADRQAGRRNIQISVQITGMLGEEEAVFWLKHQGPVTDARIAVQDRCVDRRLGGFYCYEHRTLENLVFTAYRLEQATWRFCAATDVGGERLEMEMNLAVVTEIEWEVE